MNKLIMLVGLPASGKSSFAKVLSKKENAIILSSDELRKELYGDINDKEHNVEIFEELHKRLKKNLLEGKNVIYDATNINSRRRKGFLSQLKGNKYKDVEKICYYMNTSLIDCLNNNLARDGRVPTEIISKMYKTLQIPMYCEGWDKINTLSQSNDNLRYMKLPLEQKILEHISYERLFKTSLITYFKEFQHIFNLSQDSSYHSLSVSRHIYYVYDYIYNNYNEEDKLVMLWSALLHDIGKAYCKNFKENSKYANFIGHENVSAQLTIKILNQLGYDDEFILKVAELVQLHMRLSWEENKKAEEKILKVIGVKTFNKLSVLREADIQAK